MRKYIRKNIDLSRRGHAMALGALPKFALTGRLDVVLPALIACTTVQNSSEEKWAEGRRDSVRYSDDDGISYRFGQTSI